jgi:SAM-dependent methyltransferase
MDWFENADFWDAMAPYMFDDLRWERASDEIDGALELLQPAEGAHFLDLCCGPGRHSVELHQRGFAVTSVDRHQPYLDVLHERQPGIETVCRDMREFVREGVFDAALNLFTSFGYFEDPADDLLVLRNVRESLRPGGRFLMDTMSKEVFAMQRPAPAYETTEDGAFFLREVELAEDWGSVRATWRLIQDGEVKSFRFFHRLYSGTELRALLLEAGFGEVKLYGALDGRAFDLNARRLVVLATA